MHILLIDDSSSTRSLLRTLINSGQSVRHEISEAASGEEALQKVGSGEINLPDLVIMDINMGGMSGYELCKEFRQRHGTASDVVPYIISSPRTKASTSSTRRSIAAPTITCRSR